MPKLKRPAAFTAGRFSFWSTVMVMAAFAGTTHAGPGGNGGPPIRIQVPGTITLQPILTQEILVGSDVRSVGSTSQPFDPNAPFVDAGLNAAPGASLGINPEVLRQVMGLWRIRIPPWAPGTPAVAIDYQLTSPLGTLDALGLTTQPATMVDVAVVDLGYRITRRGQGQGRQDIEGDVEFRFQSASLNAAGRYSGELLITVNFL